MLPGHRPVGDRRGRSASRSIPTLDMYDPDNGWRPWPEPSPYDPAWLARYRAAQRARVARIDAVGRGGAGRPGRSARRRARRRSTRPARPSGTRPGAGAVHARYLTIYRTLADPAYLDPTIDPDDRAAGHRVRSRRPHGRQLRLRRTGPHDDAPAAGCRPGRGCRPRPKLADTMPSVTVPTLVVHPTGDTEIRLHQAEAIRDAAGADDMTYVDDRRRAALPARPAPGGARPHRRLVQEPLLISDAAGHVGEAGVVVEEGQPSPPVGPLRCLDRCTSAVPRSGDSGLYTSSR